MLNYTNIDIYVVGYTLTFNSGRYYGSVRLAADLRKLDPEPAS